MEIKIYDYIGFGGVIAQDVINNIGNETDVHLRINSPGGSVSEAIALVNYLRSSGKNVTATVDGYGASAASVIMMAASTIRVFPSSIIMLHKPSNVVWGNADEMRKEADVLDIHEDAIMALYRTRKNLKITDDELRGLIQDETWILGDRAVEMGLADELIEEEEDEEKMGVAAMFSYALCNRKIMEAAMTKTETRKEIAAERDELSAKVQELQDQVQSVSALIADAQNQAKEANEKREAVSAELVKANEAFAAFKDESEAKAKDLSDRISAISEGLKNPAFADAAMIAAGEKVEMSVSDAEADEAEEKALEQAKDDAPKSKFEQFEAMPPGPERTAFWNKNKAEIFREQAGE